MRKENFIFNLILFGTIILLSSCSNNPGGKVNYGAVTEAKNDSSVSSSQSISSSSNLDNTDAVIDPKQEQETEENEAMLGSGNTDPEEGEVDNQLVPGETIVEIGSSDPISGSSSDPVSGSNPPNNPPNPPIEPSYLACDAPVHSKVIDHVFVTVKEVKVFIKSGHGDRELVVPDFVGLMDIAKLTQLSILLKGIKLDPEDEIYKIRIILVSQLADEIKHYIVFHDMRRCRINKTPSAQRSGLKVVIQHKKSYHPEICDLKLAFDPSKMIVYSLKRKTFGHYILKPRIKAVAECKEE